MFSGGMDAEFKLCTWRLVFSGGMEAEFKLCTWRLVVQ